MNTDYKIGTLRREVHPNLDGSAGFTVWVRFPYTWMAIYSTCDGNFGARTDEFPRYDYPISWCDDNMIATHEIIWVTDHTRATAPKRLAQLVAADQRWPR